jgi:glyoxylase-like metal-dependent hydrolase (beta-lactamase superfamily II)
MIEAISANIYKIEIPLPNIPLKFINSYLIRAPERNLIVDTGLNRKECLDTMVEDLRKVGVNLAETDFFITHFHVDHLGLVSNLLTNHSVIYFNQPEAERLEENRYRTIWKEMLDFTRLNGFPENELQEILLHHPAHQYYGFKEHMPFKFLEDKDTLHLGDYLLTCVRTPGHSKGHTCLYEPYKKILFSGDHILNGITPNISLRSHEENPLRDYLVSLDKVYSLDIELVLPGHGRIFKDSKTRIKELESHHEKRNVEVTLILRKGNQNAYQVASQMSWDIPYDSWDHFPPLPKWFAIGEAMAHLQYLEEMSVVKREVREQEIIYSLNE